jgi:hypothetical protein
MDLDERFKRLMADAVAADVESQRREMSERRAIYLRGRRDERAAVVAWLQSLDRLELAKHIDQCAHTDEE